jgi:chromosome segregation ATPase
MLSENTVYDNEMDNFFELFYGAISKLETMRNIKGINSDQKYFLNTYIRRLNDLEEQFHTDLKKI